MYFQAAAGYIGGVGLNVELSPSARSRRASFLHL